MSVPRLFFCKTLPAFLAVFWLQVPLEAAQPAKKPNVLFIAVDDLNDWVNCIRNSEKSVSDFSYSGPLTESIILGTLAIRTGKALEWDAKNMKASGRPEAEPLIKRAYRPGYMG